MAIGVFISPGRTALTRMPWRALPMARCCVSEFTPALEIWYAAVAVEQIEAIDEMFTIDPPPRSRITGMTALQVRHMPVRFTSKMRCHASSSTLRGRAGRRCRCRRCCAGCRGRRSARAAAVGIVAHDASSVMSAAWPTASPPSSRIIATVSSADSRSRSTTRTRAPSRAKRIDVARPLPMVSPGVCPPPTTTATRPASRSPMRSLSHGSTGPAPACSGRTGVTRAWPRSRPAPGREPALASRRDR